MMAATGTASFKFNVFNNGKISEGYGLLWPVHSDENVRARVVRIARESAQESGGLLVGKVHLVNFSADVDPYLLAYARAKYGRPAANI